MEIKSEHRELFNEIVSKIDKKEYEYRIENGEVMFFISYYVDSHWVMTYDVKINRMCVDYWIIWSKFTSKFGLNFDQVKAITSVLVEEYTKINGVITHLF